MKPIDMICKFNVKQNLSLNALPPGDTDCKGSCHLVIQKRHSLGIIVQTEEWMRQIKELGMGYCCFLKASIISIYKEISVNWMTG